MLTFEALFGFLLDSENKWLKMVAALLSTSVLWLLHNLALNEAPYGAAKAGLHSLTQSFSRAYAPKVRVNCIMPGPFLTDISDAWSEATHESLKALPLGRGGNPNEIVGAALYFASEASSFTTGAVLKIDGGLIASPS